MILLKITAATVAQSREDRLVEADETENREGVQASVKPKLKGRRGKLLIVVAAAQAVCVVEEEGN